MRETERKFRVIRVKASKSRISPRSREWSGVTEIQRWFEGVL